MGNQIGELIEKIVETKIQSELTKLVESLEEKINNPKE